LAAKARLPVISGERPYADEGGLMPYGPSYVDQLRRSATYVDKLLKGAKPSDLPSNSQPNSIWSWISRRRRF